MVKMGNCVQYYFITTLKITFKINKLKKNKNHLWEVRPIWEGLAG